MTVGAPNNVEGRRGGGLRAWRASGVRRFNRTASVGVLWMNRILSQGDRIGTVANSTTVRDLYR